MNHRVFVLIISIILLVDLVFAGEIKNGYEFVTLKEAFGHFDEWKGWAYGILSPTGEHIARVKSGGEDHYDYILILNTITKEIIKVGGDEQGFGIGSQREWSPSGKYLAFMGTRDEGGEILHPLMIYDVLDKHIAAELTFPYGEYTYDLNWSQDEEWIVYAHMKMRKSTGIEIWNWRTNEIRRLTDSYDYNLRLSTNDNILFSRGIGFLTDKLVLYDFNNSKENIVFEGRIGDYYWSPDGRYIVICGLLCPEEGQKGRYIGIYPVSYKDDEIRVGECKLVYKLITPEAGCIVDFIWTQDSKYLVVYDEELDMKHNGLLIKGYLYMVQVEPLGEPELIYELDEDEAGFGVRVLHDGRIVYRKGE